jgi:UDP:flavonoid glycosyltransferase YjiC (YdhE family)
MRVLFTCRPAHGHFHPLVPLARAVIAAGHDAVFATGEPFRATAEAAGFRAFGAGLSADQWHKEMQARFGDIRQIPPAGHRAFFFGRVFTELEVPARAADLLAIIGRWRPEGSSAETRGWLSISSAKYRRCEISSPASTVP